MFSSLSFVYPASSFFYVGWAHASFSGQTKYSKALEGLAYEREQLIARIDALTREILTLRERMVSHHGMPCWPAAYRRQNETSFWLLVSVVLFGVPAACFRVFLCL